MEKKKYRLIGKTLLHPSRDASSSLAISFSFIFAKGGIVMTTNKDREEVKTDEKTIRSGPKFSDYLITLPHITHVDYTLHRVSMPQL